MTKNTSTTDEESVEYSKIFEKLNDPCVIFTIKDKDPKIIEFNNKFVEVFCDNDVDPTGQSLNDLIVPEENIREAYKLDSKTENNEFNRKLVSRKTSYGKSDFLYQGTPLDNKKGFAIYTDIKDRIQEKEYISVLNRILRHNLKNKLTIIKGHTEIIKDSDNSGVDDNIDSILKSVQRIERLIEESDIIRKIIESDQTDTRSVQLQPIIHKSADSTVNSLNCGKVEIKCSSDICVNAGSRLNIAMSSLIDNSIRHNNSKEESKVNITCEDISDDKVKIKIKDNGPGIPLQEANIINKNKKITQLNHGSGLGLWMVKWIVEKYNGDINIKKPESGGTLVEIILNSYNENSHHQKKGSSISLYE